MVVAGDSVGRAIGEDNDMEREGENERGSQMRGIAGTVHRLA
jgi:hypothetical protein